MERKFLFLIFAIVAILIILIFAIEQFYKTSKNENIQEIINACTNLCLKAKEKGMDLSNGPCLSDNNPEWKYEDWVCDVAHWPRIAIDNLRENQCQEWIRAYEAGKIKKFVEVDPNCNFIRVG